jgi:acyl carrier protein
MSERDVRRRVRAVIGELAPLRGEETNAASLLVVDLGFDSLGIWELVTVLERELDLRVELAAEEAAFETVEDVENCVLEALAAQAEPA